MRWFCTAMSPLAHQATAGPTAESQPNDEGSIDRSSSVGRGSLWNGLRQFNALHDGTEHAARAIAERQAQHLLDGLGIHHPAVPTSALVDLPRVRVDWVPALGASGSLKWCDGAWRVLVNADEPLSRQRFTIAHEIKHIIDHPMRECLLTEVPLEQRHVAIERCCDYFAGCLLVPASWLQFADRLGTSEESLAAAFGVSRAAIRVRRSQLAQGPGGMGSAQTGSSGMASSSQR